MATWLKEQDLRRDLIKLKDDLAEFLNAYEMLCEKLYLVSGYSYKEMRGSDNEDEEIEKDLMDIKKSADSVRGKIRFTAREIYKSLKIKYEG